MPSTNQPQHGIQGLSVKLQEFMRRLVSLETWQRQVPSTFLQLAAPGNLAIASNNNGVMVFAGGSGPVTATVPHGLGRTPVSAFASYGINSLSVGVFIYVQSLDATNVVFRGVATGATPTLGFYWAAIG